MSENDYLTKEELKELKKMDKKDKSQKMMMFVLIAFVIGMILNSWLAFDGNNFAESKLSFLAPVITIPNIILGFVPNVLRGGLILASFVAGWDVISYIFDKILKGWFVNGTVYLVIVLLKCFLSALFGVFALPVDIVLFFIRHKEEVTNLKDSIKEVTKKGENE